MSVPSQVMSLNLKRRGDSRALINEQASRELIFAVVGPVGSGTTFVAEKLVSSIGQTLKTNFVVHIKASSVIAGTLEPEKLKNVDKLTRARILQDAGDKLRAEDEAAIGSLLSTRIKEERENFKKSSDDTKVSAIRQEGAAEAMRVYVIDSLKHPGGGRASALCIP